MQRRVAFVKRVQAEPTVITYDPGDPDAPLVGMVASRRVEDEPRARIMSVSQEG